MTHKTLVAMTTTGALALSLGLGATFAPVAAPAAWASSDDDVMGATMAPRADWMSPDQIARLIESKGHIVRNVSSSDGHYEVYVTATDGQRLELYVDPVSGKVLRQKADD